MSELGELLALLHGAGRNYRTVRGVLRHRSTFSLSSKASERWEEELRAAGHSTGTSYARIMVGDAPAEPPDRHEMLVRFWSEPPGRLREEVEALAPNAYRSTTVRDGERWWTYSPEWGAVSNAAAGGEAERSSVGGGELWGALLDPSLWIPALDFERSGETELLGRRALRVRARGRVPRGGDPYLFRHQLAVGADGYELLVDRARGVVLRAAALLDGEEFWVSEFEELVFDEQFAAETFVFEPPPGEEVRAPDVGLHEPVTVEEAARRASFPVFYVPELPAGRWELHVMYVPPRERPRMVESVHFAYHRSDAIHHLMVAQRPASEREPDWAEHAPPGIETAEVERQGRSFTVYRPERRHGMPLTVVFDRDATALQLSSTNLDEEVLLDLAASMRPFT